MLRERKAIRKEQSFVQVDRLTPREAFLPFTGRFDCLMHFAQAAGEGHVLLEVTANRQILLVKTECFLQLFVGAPVKVGADDVVALTSQSPAEQMPASQQQWLVCARTGALNPTPLVYFSHANTVCRRQLLPIQVTHSTIQKRRGIATARPPIRVP